ncbi:glucose-1-phosphate adenylyltransferase [Desulfitispora alkaliphila]|uniref:glucose-1-phosphate adenylyltransferase n=1 Tax=Desulfitispora alkaliphila TaxID=622674 RepID=UPI003D20B58F
MKKNECVAMILAGGQGSRLGVLTKKQAKPAIPYGGKYRIIDFTLSNCANSEIETVGVLTQYNPFVLHSAIGIGAPWDLDRKGGGVYMLPPYTGEGSAEWYRGTANAIYQNLEFIEQFNPERVIILSGDHIYKMDYAAMLEYHKSVGAEVTIAVLEVPWEEASRFGVMVTDEEKRITEFQEKPEVPDSNLASMGIYIFEIEALKKHLQEDEQNLKSSNDFGKDVIPKMLREGSRLYAYPFQGYWKDVGTIPSLWQANMDLLDEENGLDLHDPYWRIYSNNIELPPHFISEEAEVKNSLINEGCRIFGQVDHSVMFTGVTVGAGTEIVDSIIMPNVTIGKNVKIYRAIIGEGTTIEDGCTIGKWGDKSGEIAVVGSEVTVGKGEAL